MLINFVQGVDVIALFGVSGLIVVPVLARISAPGTRGRHAWAGDLNSPVRHYLNELLFDVDSSVARKPRMGSDASRDRWIAVRFGAYRQSGKSRVPSVLFKVDIMAAWKNVRVHPFLRRTPTRSICWGFRWSNGPQGLGQINSELGQTFTQMVCTIPQRPSCSDALQMVHKIQRNVSQEVLSEPLPSGEPAEPSSSPAVNQQPAEALKYVGHKHHLNAIMDHRYLRNNASIDSVY